MVDHVKVGAVNGPSEAVVKQVQLYIYCRSLDMTQATVGGSHFGPFISVARGHSRE